jgi:CrcB protein
MRPGAIFLVGLGGALGSIARYLVGTLVAERWGTDWPYGTFLINISGCFAISFFLIYSTERAAVGEGWRFFFPTGFVGAYTTFSTFEFETLRLIQSGAWKRALSYVLASVLVGFAAVVLAAWAARRS